MDMDSKSLEKVGEEYGGFMKRMIFVLVLVCILSVNAFAEIFFWEDKSGVHMVNDPSKLPSKFKNKYNKMTAGQPKKEVASALALSAIKALKKLEARTEAGISYKDYPPALGEAKFEVNQYLENDKSDRNPDLKKTIAEAMDLYKFAYEVWEAKFSWEVSPDGSITIDMPGMVPYSAALATVYFLKFPDLNKDVADGGVLRKSENSKYHTMRIDVALGRVWEKASKKTADASAILKSLAQQ